MTHAQIHKALVRNYGDQCESCRIDAGSGSLRFHGPAYSVYGLTVSEMIKEGFALKWITGMCDESTLLCCRCLEEKR